MEIGSSLEFLLWDTIHNEIDRVMCDLTYDYLSLRIISLKNRVETTINTLL